ncbi:hypothetical protein HS1genome_1379 [Sulfodiicoccus acidiphilus]|uniref:Uncharacterized protein n=2 Tax=Sulfodiicoccus acidiphilus TaxID=1670455 RepID=A0A348B488_9CREN|nr:hypothetical protein HS1genome_1379 [Sulfodiicoccus acidiphilus]GGT87519.1 hypothetical protein GCM10007116_01780 [Sulfodiicoccus acidiphilus]
MRERPSMVIEPLMVPVPCDTSCLTNSKFRELLANPKFRMGMEVVDSLVDLVRDYVSTLTREVITRLNEFEADASQATFALYQILEVGGDFVLGEDLTFQGRTVVRGEFQKLMRALKVLESMKRDQDIKLTCDEIRYLTEALWEHVDKNLRRILVEVQSGS